MKLLFVVHYPVFGGPHNQARQLEEPLSDRGWESVVAIPDEPGSAAARLEAGGVDVRQLRLDRMRAKLSFKLQFRFLAGFIPGIRRLRALIRTEEIDLVMIGGLVNPHAAIAARLEHKPVVWQIVDTRTPAPLVKLIMPIVRRLADAILVTGMDVAAAHPGATSIGDRLVSFFPPVDTEKFRMDPQLRDKARNELGFDIADTVIGSVSNINPQKDQLTFIRAAAILKKRAPGVRFAIMGAKYPDHADYFAQLESTAAELGLKVGSDLIFHDPGSEVARYCSALDIFWLTSEPRSEGIPTVVEEAMSLGLPVVTTDVGSVRAAVQDGITGFVVPPKDPAAIARRTEELLDSDELREQFSTAARACAEQEFSREQCADAHLQAFEAASRHARKRNGS